MDEREKKRALLEEFIPDEESMQAQIEKEWDRMHERGEPIRVRDGSWAAFGRWFGGCGGPLRNVLRRMGLVDPDDDEEEFAMLAALDHPDRVASLTLVGSSPGGPELPEMSEEFLAYTSGAGSLDWSDREAVIEYVIGLLRVFSGGSGHLDEAAMRDLVGRDVDRTRNVASSQINHFAMDVGEPFCDRLGEIGAPTLVIHGDKDSVFPLGHALALEKEIPAAELLVLERTGHELPRAVWEIVVPAMLRHTSGG